MMEKIKQYKWIIIIGLIVFGLYFYWYQWKPHETRKFCGGIANKESHGSIVIFEKFYKRCLNIQGFER